MSNPSESNPHMETRAVRALARSMHRKLRDGGYSNAQVIDFAAELVELVREHYRGDDEQALVAE